MRPVPKILPVALAVILAAALTLTAFDASAARKKQRKRPPAPAMTTDYDGTPVIMKGYRAPQRTGTPPNIMRDEPGQPRQRASRPVPRGSSTYIPPPVPSPNSPNSPGSTVVQPPPPTVYTPPPIDSLSDRVTRCTHSFPLQGGVGNNPSNRDAYIRQCAN